MSFKYDIGDDDYPNYAKQASFSMPVGNSNDVIVARRTHQSQQSLKGWLLSYVGDDPESEWTLYKAGMCIRYPWKHDPERSKNLPDQDNDVTDAPWEEPTGSVNRFMKKHYLLLVNDERVVRTIERYRR